MLLPQMRGGGAAPAAPDRSESGKGTGRFSGRRSRRRDHFPASDATASISISIFGSGSATTTLVVRAG